MYWKTLEFVVFRLSKQCWNVCVNPVFCDSAFHRSSYSFYFHFKQVSLQCCWLGDRKGIRPVKSWVLVCWWWHFDWNFAHLIAPVVTTTAIILSSNKIQNGDILVPAYPGCPGKGPLNGHSFIPFIHIHIHIHSFFQLLPLCHSCKVLWTLYQHICRNIFTIWPSLLYLFLYVMGLFLKSRHRLIDWLIER